LNGGESKMTITELALIIAKWDGRPWHREEYIKEATALREMTGGDVDKVHEVFGKIKSLMDDTESHSIARHSFADFFRDVVLEHKI